ncbi:MAG: zinc ribbon domain-containing protein [Clostridium sp.]|uniref:zinc ribbon domain-containing protein n=1 Tax=Clostridium sp. TaxID=1506 RepID=UPI00291000F9|nr:zinc ribbon domain-containing protein [Clostridium sp.]MDU5111850.1 zinc ribbon domain-containing protein [Clostridium sp.]
MICRNCGSENEEIAKFCKKCGTKLIVEEVSSEEEKIDEEKALSGQTSVKNNKLTSHQNNKKKKSIIIGAIIISIVAIMAIFIGVNGYKSENVSKKVIKNDFMGRTVKVGSMNIDINKDNLKSVKLEDKVIKTEFGIRTYDNKGMITLEGEKYKVELPIEITYIYDGRDRSWMLGTNSIDTFSEDVQVEIKEEASEDIVKKAFIGGEINGVEITEEVANGLVIDSMEEDEYGTVIKAYSTLENKGNFVTKKMSLESRVSFDGEKWVFDDNKNRSSEEMIIVTQPSGELTIDEIKKDLLMLVEDKKFSGYKGFNTISVSLDDISNIKDLEVDSITNNSGVSYIITANIAGKSNNMTFDGDIEITVSEDGYAYCDANFNKISVDNPTEEQVKAAVAGEELKVWIDKNSKYHLITDKDKETFKLNEIIDYKDDAFTKHVYGNMTYTEQGKTITSDLIYMKMYYNTSENEWTVSKMVSSTDTSFARYYGKDVINK